MMKMQTRHATGTRSFTGDLSGGPLPGSPYRTGKTQVLVETEGAEGRPVRMSYRFAPEKNEFRMKLPMLARATRQDVFELARSTADVDAAAVTYDAPPEVVAALGTGLTDLEAFGRAVANALAAFDPKRFKLRAVELDRGQP